MRRGEMLYGASHAEPAVPHLVESLNRHCRSRRQRLGNLPIGTMLPREKSVDEFCLENVVCHESLGGLLKHYGGERRN